MPTTLCFDLDNTLLDDDASLRACVHRVCEDLTPHLPPFDADALCTHYIGVSDGYWLSQPYAPSALPDARLRFWAETLAIFGCDDPKVALLGRDAYAQYRYEVCLTYDDTQDVLAELHGRYRLAVITNGLGEQQRARLQKSGLERYFDAIVASTDVEVNKPDAAVFHHTLKLLGADPADTWHIGDSLSADVQGAHNAGLAAAVWINRRAAERLDTDPTPHYEVASLSAFKELLARFES